MNEKESALAEARDAPAAEPVAWPWAEDIELVRMAAKEASRPPYEWTVLPTPNIEDAKACVTEQVEMTKGRFIGEMHALSVGDGDDRVCVALTGCGPTSAANAQFLIYCAHFVVKHMDALSAAPPPVEANQQQAKTDRLTAELDELRRLLDGVPQDAIDGGWTARGMSAHCKRLEAELSAAKAEAEELRKERAAIAELIAAARSLNVRPDGRGYFESGQDCQRFRAALAAVTAQSTGSVTGEDKG